MNKAEEKISLTLWNMARGTFPSYYKILFGTEGKMLSAFQRGVSNFIHSRPENRISISDEDISALEKAFLCGCSRVDHEASIISLETEVSEWPRS